MDGRVYLCISTQILVSGHVGIPICVGVYVCIVVEPPNWTDYSSETSCNHVQLLECSSNELWTLIPSHESWQGDQVVEVPTEDTNLSEQETIPFIGRYLFFRVSCIGGSMHCLAMNHLGVHSELPRSSQGSPNCGHTRIQASPHKVLK